MLSIQWSRFAGKNQERCSRFSALLTQGGYDHPVETSPVRGIRAQNRADITAELLTVARRQLAEHGAAALSLRAIARELGMVSSALFRYVANRDDLLTLLIVAAYDDQADAVEKACAAIDRSDVVGRWHALADAFRIWSLAHPHEYALIYGTPVPRYAAPPERTVAAGTRVLTVLAELGRDAWGRRRRAVPFAFPAHAAELAERATANLRSTPPISGWDVDPVGVANGLTAWTLLVGAVSAEIFGQLGEGTIADPAAYFTYQMSVARVVLLGR
jgi:AcrR family transcriptional regulator